jgi:Serine carboxypeptidase
LRAASIPNPPCSDYLMCKQLNKKGFPTFPRKPMLPLAVVFLGGFVSACAITPAPADSMPFDGQTFVTAHRGVFNGQAVDYLASVDATILTNETGDPVASIYATSYVRENITDRASRPVIFIWNGGPSAASQTLHMAGFGPKRLIVPLDVNEHVAAPYKSADNVHTVLDVADLVFVDPVETGFSRLLPGGDKDYFFSADGDAESIAQFIQKWLKKNGRENSPKYVMGSSYGSIRAALVAGVLSESTTPLDGAILFSQGLNLVETTQRNHNLVGYAINMSQIAAIAWYHGRSSLQDRPVAEVIDEMQDFAMNDYLVALARGRNLPDAERRAIAKRLADLTGIGVEYYLTHDLRIKKPAFRRELLKEQGLVLGSGDARYTAAADADGGPANPTEGVAPVHREHLENFLGVTLPPDEYRGFAPDTGDNWDYGGWTTLGGGKVPAGSRRSIFADYDYPGEIQRAFDASSQFHVMIATGIYDTLTTVGPARLLAATPGYPGECIEMHEYVGGHAFYSNAAEFERLANDVRNFVTR